MDNGNVAEVTYRQSAGHERLWEKQDPMLNEKQNKTVQKSKFWHKKETKKGR